MASGNWQTSGGGTGTGVDSSMTAAQLETARSSGSLTALTVYAASDTGALYWAATVDTLDPLGGLVYTSDSSTGVVTGTGLGALFTGGQIDVRGYHTLTIGYINQSGGALTGFEVSVKQGSGAWVPTHSTATDFLSAPDPLLVDLATDDTSLAINTMASAKTATLTLDVRGKDYVRVRTSNTSAGTCDWYWTAET